MPPRFVLLEKGRGEWKIKREKGKKMERRKREEIEEREKEEWEGRRGPNAEC